MENETANYPHDGDIDKLIEKSIKTELCMTMLELTYKECQVADIQFNDYTWKAYVNHIAETVKRFVLKEELPNIDPSDFGTIGSEVMEIAKKVISLLGEVKEEETYMIAIHIETAKNIGSNEKEAAK